MQPGGKGRVRRTQGRGARGEAGPTGAGPGRRCGGARPEGRGRRPGRGEAEEVDRARADPGGAPGEHRALGENAR